MYAHLCKGLSWNPTAHMYNEITLPYAGIIRIRFMGMISAPVTRDTPAYFPSRHAGCLYFFSTNLTS